MEDKEGMSMSVIKDGGNHSFVRNAEGPEGATNDDERAFLISNGNKEKSNGSSTTASYRSLLAISEDSKEYPSTHEINRSHYMENTTT